MLPVVIISNERKHEQNIALTCNQLLVKFITDLVPGVTKVHFWSDGHGSQFRLQYTLHLLCDLQSDLEYLWNYGEAHHFKGPHDGICGSVTSQKVVKQNAKHFATYAKSGRKFKRIKRISNNKLEFFYNSQYKKKSELFMKVKYGSNEASGSTEEHFPTHKTFQKSSEKSLCHQIGDIIIVNYTTVRKVLIYLGVVQPTNGENFHVQYLKSSGGKTLSLKIGYEDEVTAESILPVMKTFSVNTLGQHIMDTEFTFDM